MSYVKVLVSARSRVPFVLNVFKCVTSQFRLCIDILITVHFFATRENNCLEEFFGGLTV
jgi:hypothetical protein